MFYSSCFNAASHLPRAGCCSLLSLPTALLRQQSIWNPKPALVGCKG
jgi:hypothetical protein